MKEKTKKNDEGLDNTNPYPIYPDIDKPVKPTKAGKVTEEELEQEVDLINPDPNSLDRG